MRAMSEEREMSGLAAALRVHGWFIGTAAVCAAAFAWMISYGSFRLAAADSFGTFYDYQAAALLHGRWDVPEVALGGEAFVVGGRIFGYFGPTPALLRLPFALAGAGFGQLTRGFMLADYVACLVAAYLILGCAARWGGPGRRPGPGMVVMFTTAVGLGSTLFFLGSRAYVYHEAILCGAAFALWATYAGLRYLAEPGGRWWIGALGCGVLAVHARPPIGLFALTFLGATALARTFRSAARATTKGQSDAVSSAVLQPALSSPAARAEAPRYYRELRRHLAVGVLSLLGVLSYNAVSYLKFGTIEGCPLRYNVQYTPERLAALDGRNFHLSNLRFNFDAYVRLPSLSVRRGFPYVYAKFIDRKRYPESRIAYRDATLAMPYGMPALCFLAIGGSILAVFAAPGRVRPLAVLWVAAVPVTLAMLTAVAVTQRYTADFSPALISLAAFGLVACGGAAAQWRALLRWILIALTCLSVAVTAAITLHHQRAVVWGVPVEVQREYDHWRQRVDHLFGGGPGASSSSTSRPRAERTAHLRALRSPSSVVRPLPSVVPWSFGPLVLCLKRRLVRKHAG